MSNQDNLEFLKQLLSRIRDARINSIHVARNEGGDIHTFFLKFDDGRFLQLGEYSHNDPPRLIELPSDFLFEPAEDDDSTSLIGKSVRGLYLDKLNRVFLEVDNNVLVWEQCGEAEMFLEIDAEPANRRGYLADLTSL